MKIRTGFVSNSSSSSFICISVGDDIIYGNEYSPNFEIDSMCLDIDTFIKQLQDAKAKGATKVEIEYGGGYEG